MRERRRRPQQRAWCVAAALCLALLLSGALSACGGRAQYPENVLASYIDHVRSKEPDAIFEMLGEQARGERSREEFREYFDQNYDEMLAQADALDAALKGEKLQIVAALPVNNNEELDFEYADHQWFLQKEVPRDVGGGDPTRTLVAFADAIEGRDLDGLLTVMTREQRETLRSELDIIEAGLRRVSKDDISVSGGTATVSLDWGIRLELKLESGVWKVSRILHR